ncbi:DUF2478 domain-containing protein [Pseudoduganella violaceinigra]|uniref:DUF2478 domain-containing protein n=1 Tax=Pseudoduganella violaceinigra TaxID=246602 RepID=UPI0003F59C0B|nr:DUF2478 domain-containing protein [Pseudoduganella violaceinigra]
MNEEKYTPPVAAIIHADHSAADKLLVEFAGKLRAVGRRVGGLVQQQCDSSGRQGTVLVDLQNGQHFPLLQNLGAGSQSCCLDETGVTSASIALRRALQDGADLAVANRFGTLEASGGGLSAEMLALIAEGVPLLTVVGDKYLQAWRNWTGELGVELPADMGALQKWFAAVSDPALPM